MRRPLALLCASVLLAMYLLRFTGVISFRVNTLLPDDGQQVTVTGCVSEIHDNYIYVTNAELRGLSGGMTDSVLRAGNDRKCPLKMKIYFEPVPDLHIGEGVTISGRFSRFSHAMNPGQFDAYDYYASKRCCGCLKGAALISSDGKRTFLKDALHRLQKALEDRIYEVCPDKEASILCDLLLGDKEGIDEDTKALYQNNGIAHILSISGLHISILGMGCYKLLRKMRCRTVPAAIFSGLLLVTYGIMTGMSISATRAIGMYVIRMFSHLFGRTEDPITSLSVMAALTAVTDPYAITEASFLLSYGAALGIFIFLPAVNTLFLSAEKKERRFREDTIINRIRELGERFGRGLVRAFVSSLGITLFTLPVQLWFFYKVSVYAVFMNLLILPCMSVLVFAGMIMMIPGLGFVGSISCILLDIFEKLCILCERLPHHDWNPGRPGAGCEVIYYLLVSIVILLGKLVADSRAGRISDAGMYLEKKGKCILIRIDDVVRRADRKCAPGCVKQFRWSGAMKVRPVYALCLIMCSFMLFVIRFPLPLKNYCTQLYIGQGNCNVMITDAGEVYMFDGGSSSIRNAGEYIIWPFLKYSGLAKIDAMFISHSDADHVNGCIELIENMDEWGLKIGSVYVTPQMMTDGSENTGRLMDACVAAGVSVGCISAGDAWQSGSTYFSCLHPSEDFVPEDPNSGSMCILACFMDEGHTLLIPGDVQGRGEEELTRAISTWMSSEGNVYAETERLDVYITAHHGSSGTSTEEFLRVTHPRLAINSAGLDNSYHHPHEETLERLEEAGCAYFTTFETGAVTMDFSGEEIKVRTYVT